MIKSLQGLRVLSMLVIFMWHCGFTDFNARIPVTFFFMLSGFLAYTTYKDREGKSVFKDSIYYFIRKIKRLYPIHLITFLISVPLRIKLILNDFGKETIVMITHLFLIQSLIPITHFYFNYNESAWYLSTLMFCYMFTEILIKKINKIKNANKKISITVIIFLVFSIQAILSNTFKGTGLSQWISYVSPIYRILDYFMGMLVGVIYANIKQKVTLNKNIMTIFEVLILFSIIISYIPLINNYYKVDMKLIILIGIFVFSLERGLVSKVLSNNVFIYFADFSFEFFMLHMPIIIICRKILEIIYLNTTILRVITVVFSFIITVILSKILNKYITKSKYKTKKQVLSKLLS